MIVMRKSKQAGFTLVELLIVIAIIGIAAGIAVPGIASWMAKVRLRSATSDLMVNLKMVRAEAVKRGQTCAVIFGQSVNGTTYDYIVFVDGDNNLEYAGPPNDTLLNSVLISTNYPGIILAANTFPNNDDGHPAVGFSSRGISRNNVSPNTFGVGTITLRNNPSLRGKQVIMSGTGSVRIEDEP